MRRMSKQIVTTFHKGKAIIGESCDKIPWDEHAKEEDCHHYSIVCKKHGYINQNGEVRILKLRMMLSFNVSLYLQSVLLSTLNVIVAEICPSQTQTQTLAHYL